MFHDDIGYKNGPLAIFCQAVYAILGFIMIELKSKCIWKIFIPGAIFFGASIAVSIQSRAVEILLSPPGLRLIKDPSLVIPADFTYSNRLIPLPAYRNPSGKPARGWSDRFVDPCLSERKGCKALSDSGLSGPP